MNHKNIQILLETTVRCGGNCSGCALSSSERMEKVEFDFFRFKTNANKVNKSLHENIAVNGLDNIESVTIFLGQGDHFLMAFNEIERFVDICSQIVPQELKHKSVIIITASAIGKESQIKEKMDKFYEMSLALNTPFFIQTVFDPKKITLHDKFKKTYMNNIMYFQEKCGITELTINLGEDMINQMSPKDFHQWIKEYNFKHVEMNWVMSKLTHNMWKENSNKMFSWLKEWLLEYKTSPSYEINFIPTMTRQIAYKNKEMSEVHDDVVDSLTSNFYVDYYGNVINCQSGIINNLTPMTDRQSTNTVNLKSIITGHQFHQALEKQARKEALRIKSSLMKNTACLECEFKTTCAISGSVAWFPYEPSAVSCPWNIKDFLLFLEENFSTSSLRKTIFNKNPVQDKSLKKDKNETYEYFSQEVDKRMSLK